MDSSHITYIYTPVLEIICNHKWVFMGDFYNVRPFIFYRLVYGSHRPYFFPNLEKKKKFGYRIF